MQKLNINDSMTTDPLTISSGQKQFSQELYTSYHGDDDEVKNFLNVLGIPKLTGERKHTCEGKFFIRSVNSCLRRLRITKCPEMTGFQLSFIKDFGQCLVNTLYTVPMKFLKIWKCVIPESKE